MPCSGSRRLQWGRLALKHMQEGVKPLMCRTVCALVPRGVTDGDWNPGACPTPGTPRKGAQVRPS